MNLVVLLTLGGIGILGAASAGAATPAFELDVVISNGSAVITVRFVQPVPEGFESSGVLNRLVGVLPADGVDDRGRPLDDEEPRLVTLRRIDQGVYQAEVPLDSAGSWAVVPWPLVPAFDTQSNPGAPQTSFFAVGSGIPLVVWLSGGAAVGIAGLFLLVWFIRQQTQSPT